MNKPLIIATVLLTGACLFGQCSASAEEVRTALPHSHAGLAAKHPGDVGIERDPNVVFVKTFEVMSLDGLRGRRHGLHGPPPATPPSAERLYHGVTSVLTCEAAKLTFTSMAPIRWRTASFTSSRPPV